MEFTAQEINICSHYMIAISSLQNTEASRTHSLHLLDRFWLGEMQNSGVHGVKLGMLVFVVCGFAWIAAAGWGVT
jgi:hypothetical protein